jgi:two-component system, cell cycle sensor histidine kinase and response regulator CckA
VHIGRLGMQVESNKNLLLVEDEVLIAMGKQKELEKYGYIVQHVNTGEKAVALSVESKEIDLILMDIDLGKGIDGTDAAALILEEHDIPIVFMSSHTEPEVVEKTERITSYGYVVKNSSITVLDASIKMAFKLFKANKQITESGLIQKAMLSKISDVIGIIGTDSIMKYKSPNIEKWFGWLPEDLIGTNGFQNVHPDDIERIQQNFTNLIESDGSTITVEYRYRCKDGSFKPIELTATNLTKDPSINGVLLNYRDISERKQANHKLIQSEKKHRLLFESMIDGVCLHEIVYDNSLKAVNYRILDVNPKYEQILQIKKEDIVGKLATEVYQTDEAPYLDAYAKVAETGESNQFEVFFPPIAKHFLVSIFSPGKGKFATIFEDITDRKQASKQLEESENRYRELYENSPLGYQSLNEEGCFVEANPALCNLLGYEHDEIRGKWFGDILTKDGVEIFRTNFPKFKAKGAISAVPFDMIAKNGNIFSVEIDGSIGYDNNGHFKQTHCVIQDVTERKQKEENLKESQYKLTERIKELNCLYNISKLVETPNITLNEIFQGIVNIIPGSWQYPEITCCKMAINNQLFTTGNYKKTEWQLQGDIILYGLNKGLISVGYLIKKPEDAEGPFLKEERSLLNSVCERLGRIIERIEAEDANNKLELKVKKYILTLEKEVEEHRRSEAEKRKFTYAVEQSPSIVIIKDIDQRVKYVNPMFTQVSKYSLNEVIGKKSDFFNTGETSSVKQIMDKITNGQIHRTVFQNRNKDGKKYWVAASVSAIRNDNGIITDYLEIQQDITEEKNLREQLLQTQKLEAIGTLASGIAHDFNNILTVILGYSEYLLSKLDKEDMVYTIMDEIREVSTRGSSLTGQLLAFSRKQMIEMDHINLNNVLNGIKKIISKLITENVKLYFDLDEELWSIEADKGQIEQILMNMSINSSHAMKDGGTLTIITKNVKTEILDQENSPYSKESKFISLSIRDTGCGMDEKTILRIFDPFFTSKGIGVGTGLGLSVVYGIVEQHKGWINVESEPGKGTEFIIFFPVLENDKLLPVEVEKQSSVIMGNGEKILIVEDDKALLSFAVRALTENGYCVFSASSVNEVFDLFDLESEAFDVVFSDVILPDINGIKLVEFLLVRNPDLRIVLTSGYTGEKSQRAHIKEKGYSFLQKPYTLKTLLPKIAEVLGKNEN